MRCESEVVVRWTKQNHGKNVLEDHTALNDQKLAVCCHVWVPVPVCVSAFLQSEYGAPTKVRSLSLSLSCLARFVPEANFHTV